MKKSKNKILGMLVLSLVFGAIFALKAAQNNITYHYIENDPAEMLPPDITD